MCSNHPLDGFDNGLEAFAPFEHPPSMYPILVRSLMPVPVMSISTFPTEIIACEDEIE